MSKRDYEALQERLTRLSEASLRINECLDFDQVLHGVLDAASSLTAARYGLMTLLDEAGGVRDFLASGMTAGEAGQLWLTPDRWRIFEPLTALSEPLRVPDLVEHVRAQGFPEFSIPLPVGAFRFLAAPLFHRGARVGQVATPALMHHVFRITLSRTLHADPYGAVVACATVRTLAVGS